MFLVIPTHSVTVCDPELAHVDHFEVMAGEIAGVSGRTARRKRRAVGWNRRAHASKQGANKSVLARREIMSRLRFRIKSAGLTRLLRRRPKY